METSLATISSSSLMPLEVEDMCPPEEHGLPGLKVTAEPRAELAELNWGMLKPSKGTTLFSSTSDTGL